MIYFLIIVISVVVGVLIGMVINNKKQIDRTMFHEIDKSFRRPMRDFLNKPAINFSETIKSISPLFCETYNQSNDAEQDFLDKICGIGYGKSLEFLIKDYAIYLHPSKKEEIEKSALSICIKTYMLDDSIKTSAELATWLRNDETHYVRKHSNKDVSDLKKLINLTIVLIESSEQKGKLDEDVKNTKDGFNS